MPKDSEKKIERKFENNSSIDSDMDLEHMFEVDSQDSEFYKALSKFFDEDIRAKTDIKIPKILTIIKMLYYKKECIANGIKDIPDIIDNVLDNYYYLQISANRKGRQEFFNALMARVSSDEPKSFMDKLLRR